MFRAIIKQHNNFDKKQIADVGVISAQISEDLSTKAVSTINLIEMPTNVSNGDIICVYDSKGKFIYFGKIEAINGETLNVSQWNSMFDDNFLFTPLTAQGQGVWFRTHDVWQVVSKYLGTYSKGYRSGKYNIEMTEIGPNDKDLRDYFTGVTIIDGYGDEQTFVPRPTEYNIKNLQSYIYEMFNIYSVVPIFEFDYGNIFPNYDPLGFKITLTAPQSIDANSSVLTSGWEGISNLSISEQSVETSTVVIYSADKSTYRGMYTVLKDGTIVPIYDDVSNPTRLGLNNTKYIFDDDNNLTDLARSQLPDLQYNHKISFNINFNTMFNFDDFKLGQKLEFYDGINKYDTLLTGWKYSIDQTSETINNASFVLGKARTTLTAKLK